MKAINCTQCGATIEDVSERSLIITCEYCNARIMLSGPEDETRPEPPRPVQVAAPRLENGDSKMSASTIGFLAALVLLIPVLVIFVSVQSDSKKEDPGSYAFTGTPYPDPTVLPIWNNPPPKPLPVVNYQPRISWEGPNDLEHFDSPEVDISSVSDLSSEEVEKTVFKDRVVKLRVVINTEGEIDEVETISGHPLLVDAATRSAKRSVFAARSKPTKRVLTYTFRVLKD